MHNVQEEENGSEQNSSSFFLALAVRKTHGMTDRIIAEDFQASVGHVQEYSARVPLKHEAREETKEH